MHAYPSCTRTPRPPSSARAPGRPATEQRVRARPGPPRPGKTVQLGQTMMYKNGINKVAKTSHRERRTDDVDIMRDHNACRSQRGQSASSVHGTRAARFETMIGYSLLNKRKSFYGSTLDV